MDLPLLFVANVIVCELTELCGFMLSRDVGYMRICDRTCDRIFCQNSHIAYFSAYNVIFRIAYAKIMQHMQKFAYIRIYATYFRICNRIFQHFPCPTLF